MLFPCESSDVGKVLDFKFVNITTSSFVLVDECTSVAFDDEDPILRRPMPRFETGKPRDDEVVVFESSIWLVLGELLTELLNE